MRTAILLSPHASNPDCGKLATTPELRISGNRLAVAVEGEAPAATSEVWHLGAAGLVAVLTEQGDLVLMTAAEWAVQL